MTGEGTGRPVDLPRLREVAAASDAPVYIGSGLTPKTARDLLGIADGAIVGSALKRGGDVGRPVDLKLAATLVRAASA